MADVETTSCNHEFGAPVMGWKTCWKCGKKERSKKEKGGNIMENVQENTQENVVKSTDREGNEINMHLPNQDEQPDLKLPKKEEKIAVVTTLSSGKTTTGPVAIITCVDCGAERIVKVQDAFQVKRCLDCQKKAVNKQRYQSTKARNARKKAEAAATASGEDTKAE